MTSLKALWTCSRARHARLGSSQTLTPMTAMAAKTARSAVTAVLVFLAMLDLRRMPITAPVIRALLGQPEQPAFVMHVLMVRCRMMAEAAVCNVHTARLEPQVSALHVVLARTRLLIEHPVKTARQALLV